MGKTLYLECYSGISGDMTVAAFLIWWPRVLKTDYGQEEAIAVFGHDPRVYQTTVTEFIKDKTEMSARPNSRN